MSTIRFHWMTVVLSISTLAAVNAACGSSDDGNASAEQPATAASSVPASAPAGSDGAAKRPAPDAGPPAQPSKPAPNDGGGAPAAAIDACAGKADGDACDFTVDAGPKTGACHTIPDGAFVCVPA